MILLLVILLPPSAQRTPLVATPEITSLTLGTASLAIDTFSLQPNGMVHALTHATIACSPDFIDRKLVLESALKSPDTKWIAVSAKGDRNTRYLLIIDNSSKRLVYWEEAHTIGLPDWFQWISRDAIALIRRSSDGSNTVAVVAGPNWQEEQPKSRHSKAIRSLLEFASVGRRRSIAKADERLQALRFLPNMQSAPGGYQAMHWEPYLRLGIEARMSPDGSVVVARGTRISLGSGNDHIAADDTHAIVRLAASSGWKPEWFHAPDLSRFTNIAGPWTLVGTGELVLTRSQRHYSARDITNREVWIYQSGSVEPRYRVRGDVLALPL